MSLITFNSKLLPDGNLYCPKKYRKNKNIKFKVIAIIDDNKIEASKEDIEASAIKDAMDDFLSQEELNYYLNLEEL